MSNQDENPNILYNISLKYLNISLTQTPPELPPSTAQQNENPLVVLQHGIPKRSDNGEPDFKAYLNNLNSLVGSFGNQNFANRQVNSFSWGLSYNNRNIKATNETIKWMSKFRQETARVKNISVEMRAGYTFEYIEAAKYNINAALKGDKTTRAYPTSSIGRRNDPLSDIDVIKGSKVIQFQAKTSSNPTRIAKNLANPKYRENGIHLLTAFDMAPAVRKEAARLSERPSPNYYSEDFIFVSKNTESQLSAFGHTSGGTTYKENIEAAKNPDLYSDKLIWKSIRREALSQGFYTFVVDLLFSTINNSIISTLDNFQKMQSNLENADDQSDAQLELKSPFQITVALDDIKQATTSGLLASIAPLTRGYFIKYYGENSPMANQQLHVISVLVSYHLIYCSTMIIKEKMTHPEALAHMKRVLILVGWQLGFTAIGGYLFGDTGATLVGFAGPLIYSIYFKNRFSIN